MQSIIGAIQRRCDKSFIQLIVLVLSRSNRYLERLTILSRGRNCSPESTEMWRSIGAPIGFVAVATAHAAHTSRISRAHSLPRPKISSGRCRPILLKNGSGPGQRGFAEGHKPSPASVAFNSGHSMRSNFESTDARCRKTSFSTESTRSSHTRRGKADRRPSVN